MSEVSRVEVKNTVTGWPWKLPDHWQWKRLKYLVRFVGGGTPSKETSQYWNGDIPWVSPKDMKCWELTETRDHISKEGLTNSTTQLVQPGAALIVVRSGILRHTLPVAVNRVEVALNQDMKAIVPSNGLDVRYLARIIEGCQDALLLEWRKFGATVESIEHEYVANTFWPLPPLDEQRAIADFLDQKVGHIDDVIAPKEEQIRLLKARRQALISHAVTRGLNRDAPMKDSRVDWIDEIPAHWDGVRVKFLSSKIGSGKTPRGGSEAYVDEGIWFIRSQNVYDDGLRLEDAVFIDAETDAEMADTRVHARDVLLNITGASIGRTCVVPDDVGPANVNQHVCIVRPSKVNPEYLAYCLKSDYSKQQIDSLQMGSSREGLNFEQVGDLVTFLPVESLDEQHAIVEYLERETNLIDTVVSSVREQVNELRTYRQVLISAVVTGQVEIPL